jgi:plastocyanin
MGSVRKIALVSCLIAGCQAAGLRGTAVIEKKLTRRSVTAPASAYQRGAAVDLTISSGDPLEYERSHVAVYIEAGAEGRGADAGAKAIAATIEQTHREFVPDFAVIPVGSTVSFPNGDPIFHNVFSLSKAKSFDLGNYSQGETRTVTFMKPGIVAVSCRLHPNMAAAIVVSPTRWCTRADAQGRFELNGLPPGKYTVVAWHKAAGFFRQKVVIAGDRAPAIRFVMPLTASDLHDVAKR